MPHINRPRQNQTIEVNVGENLMSRLLAADIPVASSCHGEGICGKCRLQILKGAENLSDPTSLEEDLLQRQNGMRLSCQAAVKGDVSVDATYW